MAAICCLHSPGCDVERSSVQGNSKSEVCVHSSLDGSLQAQVALPVRMASPVMDCALSEDCRHLLVAAGNGFVLRFEVP